MFRTATKAAKAGDIEIGGRHYKRVPRGFDADHPRAEWLLHKGLWAGLNEPIPDELFTGQAMRFVARRLKQLAPVQRWIADVVS